MAINLKIVLQLLTIKANRKQTRMELTASKPEWIELPENWSRTNRKHPGVPGTNRKQSRVELTVRKVYF